jgi:hypothetical protein
MGLDYGLHLATEMKREQALDLIGQHIQGLQWDAEHATFFNADIIITGGPMDELSQSIMEEGFHFRPNLFMLFRHPSNRDFEKFVRMLLRGALLLLEHGQDGVLLFSGETIVLQRLRGELLFNSGYILYEDQHWIEAHVPVPFAWRLLPSPLL